MHPALAEIPFRLDFPFEVFHKAGTPGRERRIAGIISTEHEDRQGEVVLQRGLDLDDFVKHGWFNDNHSQGTADVVGYPELVERVTFQGKPATRVEGYLLEGHKPSDRIWDLAQALQKTDRKLGFSVEGKVLRRLGPEGKVIAKAKVNNVAITSCPVNTVTGLEVIAKSMAALEQLDDPFARALAAGAAITAPGSATPGDGFALRAESLESDLATPTGSRKKKKKKKQRALHLTKADACRWISRRYPRLGRDAVERIWQWAITTKGE